MVNIDRVYKVLEKEFQKYDAPVVDLVEAQTNDPFKILVTTILSARTKDTTTSEVVLNMFEYIYTPDDLKNYTLEEIEEMIYPVGFFRNKAIHLKKLPDVLKEKFNNKVPEEIDELLELPGVGRKTANLVRAIAFKKPAICVDVHVHRISNRLGYVQTSQPVETEMKLREILPQKYWLNYNSYLVAFGQNHCTPRNPKCTTCLIYDEECTDFRCFPSNNVAEGGACQYLNECGPGLFCVDGECHALCVVANGDADCTDPEVCNHPITYINGACPDTFGVCNTQ